MAAENYGNTATELLADRELRGSRPRVYDLERVDGVWLISELVDQTEATITC